MEIYPSRPKAWIILGAGWLLAQSLLTLIPLAPNVWAVAGLALGGSVFLVPVAKGIWLLTLKGPSLVVSKTGIALTPQRGPLHLEWADLEALELTPMGRRRLKIRLKDPDTLPLSASRRAIMRLNRTTRGAEIVFSPWDIDGSLTDLHEAVRHRRDS
ncbi:MAG: hypothetical protein AAFR17_10385 [Pseudomonadota bacterium]